MALFSNDPPRGRHDTTHRGSKDTTFLDTMEIVNGSHGREGSCLVRGPEEEDALTSKIWLQHANGLPMPDSPYLTHEPSSCVLARKGVGVVAPTAFTVEILRSFRPPLDTLKAEGRRDPRAVTARTGLALAGTASDKPEEIPAKPKTLFSSDISEPQKKEDYASRLFLVPFTQFLRDDRDVGVIGVGKVSCTLSLCQKYNTTCLENCVLFTHPTIICVDRSEHRQS